MKTNIISSLIKYHVLLLSGRMQIEGCDSHEKGSLQGYRCFLHVSRRDLENSDDRCTRLSISFKVRKLDLLQRILIPMASIPFFAGRPGFIGKRFLVCEPQNALRGEYEWSDEGAVRCYLSSYAMTFMRLLAIPGSLHVMIETSD